LETWFWQKYDDLSIWLRKIGLRHDSKVDALEHESVSYGVVEVT
jgi:hypothetical protein